MKKLFIFGALLFLWSCAAPLEYDHAIFSINPDVKLLNINTNSTVRERDGQMLSQVSGTGKKNQSVYYKIEWFDANGMRISTKLAQWKKVNLRKNAEFLWSAAAPSKRAVSYRVYITDDIGNGLIE